MLIITWQNVLIWSLVIATVLLVLGGAVKVLKRFIKFWLVVAGLLVVVKWAVDAGWLKV